MEEYGRLVRTVEGVRWDGCCEETRTGRSACATRSESPAKLTGVGGSDILLVSDYIAKEH